MPHAETLHARRLLGMLPVVRRALHCCGSSATQVSLAPISMVPHTSKCMCSH